MFVYQCVWACGCVCLCVYVCVCVCVFMSGCMLCVRTHVRVTAPVCSKRVQCSFRERLACPCACLGVCLQYVRARGSCIIQSAQPRLLFSTAGTRGGPLCSVLGLNPRPVPYPVLSSPSLFVPPLFALAPDGKLLSPGFIDRSSLSGRDGRQRGRACRPNPDAY